MSGEAPGLKAWTYLSLLGLLWGGSFMLTNIAVQEIPPLTLAALRLSFGGCALFIIAQLVGAHIPRPSEDGGRFWRIGLLAALLGGTFPFWLIGISQFYIPSAMMALLLAPMPIVSLILSHFLVAGERMNAPRIAGFCLAFIGVASLIAPEAFRAADGSDGILGHIAGLGAMLCYALSGIVLKRAGPAHPVAMSALIISLGAAMSIPLALIIEAPDLSAIGPGSWAASVALGLLPTGVAQILMMAVITLAGPPFLSTVNYQAPLWAAAFGVVFLSEDLPAAFWLALALIIAGLGLAQFGGRRRRAR